jgi:flagellar assembly factor FliW
MAVTLDSTRFGTIAVPEDALIEFPYGLIGLPSRQYALLAQSEEAAFMWLHSTEHADLAIPVTNPFRFFDSYEVELSDDEAARIGITESDDTSIYVTVRAAPKLEEFSANLRAPILVCAGRGHQIINQSPDAPVQAPLFGEIAYARQTACA